jgi:hypothetical protein
MIIVGATSLLQALWDVVVWILVVLAEFAAVAVIVAPRAVARKLRALGATLARRAGQALGPARARREGREVERRRQKART